MRRVRRTVAALVLGLCGLAAAALALDRLCPPDLSRLTPSVTVLDRHGTLLRAFPTADGQWRLPVETAAVSPDYLRLLLATEDRRFYRHFGVDPLALARAAGQLVARGRVVSGGSTLTMQLVRLLEPRPRTVRSKLIEMVRAAQIEARMDKAAILAAYLTLTPMGGNLQGVRAGSLAWFGVEPRALTPAQAALLVALPQAPRAARPDRHPERALLLRRKVLAGAARIGLLAQADVAGATAAPIPQRRLPLPRLAPHLAERLAAGASVAEPIRTALDAPLQAGVERALARELESLPRPVDIAAMVVDRHTGEVLARAGSADDRDAGRRGAVDMTVALRSPGSTLKPFIYGLAFDALLAHPGSTVPDEPTRFDDYAPHDFDGAFRGDVTVRRALQMSLNLPAVIALQRIGPIAFAARFREAGLPLTFDEAAAPSLPLALGGTGLTLERLVTAYRALSDGGTVRPLVERFGLPAPPAPPNDRLLGPAAADAVVDILAGMPPPRGVARGMAKGVAAAGGRIAFKTGTSYRFRDGWAIGFDEGRVIGVWVGRADGGSCAPCLGATAAGVLFRLFDLMAPQPLLPRALAPLYAGPPPPALLRLTAAPRPAAGPADAPRSAFPLPGARLLVDAEPVHLSVAGGRRPFRWIVDGRALPSRSFARDAAWRPDGAGFATVGVVDADGHGDEVQVRVIERSPEHLIDGALAR